MKVPLPPEGEKVELPLKIFILVLTLTCRPQDEQPMQKPQKANKTRVFVPTR